MSTGTGSLPDHGSNRTRSAKNSQIARVTASATTRLVLLGGPPVGHRLIYWNFVASSQDKIDRAKQAWRAQTFAPIPTDHDDFVPLPDEHH